MISHYIGMRYIGISLYVPNTFLQREMLVLQLVADAIDRYVKTHSAMPVTTKIFKVHDVPIVPIPFTYMHVFISTILGE